MSYDYIIVGGGAAGAVLANRLSANPDVNVVLVEQGSDRNSSKAIIRIPLAMVTFMATALAWLGGPHFVQWFETVREAGLNNRRIALPRGRGTGGSTLINGQIWIRGQREDYDHWRELGNPGWGYDDLLPYFKRSERFTPLTDPHSESRLPESDARAAQPHDYKLHGNNGPVTVSPIRAVNPLAHTFAKVMRSLGYRFNADFNGKNQAGYGFYTFTQKDGQRVTAENAYIDPIRHRKNLHILAEHRVTKVIMEGRRAIGVEWLDKTGNRGTTLASEVILSAGSYVSPQLLMLSGIGDREHLQRHGIDVLHHLPGVGRNLQDHLDITLEYQARDTTPYAASWRALPRNILHLADWIFRKRGLFASTTADGGAFLSTTGQDRPDIQLFFCSAMANTQNANGFGTHGYMMHVCELRPGSIGEVRLASNNPMQSPEICYNFFSGQSSAKVLTEGLKIARNIMLHRGFSQHHAQELAPGAEVESDIDLEAFIRRTVGTLFHPVGTCKMGRDEQAVVDPATLQVHGTTGLRIVDASIMPTIVSGNTVAACYAIAEKAADLIQQNA